MDGKEILVIGSGLSGLSIALELSKEYDVEVIETKDYIGGFYINDKLKIFGESGEEIIKRYIQRLNDNNVKLSTYNSGLNIKDKLYIIGIDRFEEWNGVAIGATGFRCLTPSELNIYGYRPAGIYCVNTVLDIIRDGYIPGEKIIIYGLNRYVITLLDRLRKIKSIKNIIVVSPELKDFHDILLDWDITFYKDKILWINGRDRVESVKLSNNKIINGDTLILGYVTPFNYLNLDFNVGNSAIIIENPYKIIELSKITYRNIHDILNGSDMIKINSEAFISPKIVSRDFRKIMAGYPEDTVLDINGREIIIREEYEVIEIPDEDKIYIKVVR